MEALSAYPKSISASPGVVASAEYSPTTPTDPVLLTEDEDKGMASPSVSELLPFVTSEKDFGFYYSSLTITIS
jgi:hypothetical protein